MNEIHSTARISTLADIEYSVRGSNLIIGENVMIDSFVKVKFAGGTGNIEIGSNSYINAGCVLYSGSGISIGKNVLIAANCTLAPVNHAYELRNMTILEQRFKPGKGGIVIEDDVWIGAGAIILDGAHLKKGTVIGAASVVTITTEEYGVYFGNPLWLKKYRQ
jgi:acetyltransferase-like isoleucine patch superfamily enzyme